MEIQIRPEDDLENLVYLKQMTPSLIDSVCLLNLSIFCRFDSPNQIKDQQILVWTLQSLAKTERYWAYPPVLFAFVSFSKINFESGTKKQPDIQVQAE